MSDPFVSVGGVLGRGARAVVPWTGVPVVQVDFAEEIELPGGPTTLTLGALELACVVLPEQSGDYALSSHWTLVGGRGGWQKTVAAKNTHNDALVKRSDVATEIAAAVGETVVVDAGADGPVGVDYMRRAGAASRTLELLFPASAWWVATDGSTHVGARPTRDVTGLVEVLDVDPRNQTATLVADDPTNVLPGCSFIDDRFPGAFLIHDCEFVAVEGRARAYVTASSARDSKLLGLLGQLVQRAAPRLPYAFLYEYRVVSMASNRVNLQYVPDPLEPAPPGLPDAVPIAMTPGMAGLWASLAQGSKVLLTFVAGNPGRPTIVSFAAKDDNAFVPVALELDASTSVTVGETAQHVYAGGREPSNPATAAGEHRFVCWGDMMVNPVGGTPLAITPHATNSAMSKAGNKP